MKVHSLRERKLERELLSLKQKHENLFRDTVQAIICALEAKDPYTHGHSVRVAEYALFIGRALKLTEEELFNLELSALLHDIGKIGTPDHILLKPVVDIVKYHQERMDGFGYPQGLKGENIPLLSRIVYVADAFDAMTSDRPYRKALSDSLAYEELLRCSGDQFDTRLVNIFIQEHRSKKHIPQKTYFFPKPKRRKAAIGE